MEGDIVDYRKERVSCMHKEPFQPSHHDSFLAVPEWNQHDSNLIVGFSTKNGGVSQNEFESLNLGLHVDDKKEDVLQNRRILAEAVDAPLEQWTFAEQVHNNNVMKVSSEDAGKGMADYEKGMPQTDAIYTDQSNLLLALCFADCVPLYFYEPTRGLIGLAHAGWKGTVKNIGGEMVNAWVKNEGVAVENIRAVIGPSIGACCYHVDDYVIKFVDEAIGNNKVDVYQEVSKGQYALSLQALNAFLLEQAGVKTANIRSTSRCTSCEEDLFFSHRRDCGKTGRMLSFIGYKEV